MKRLITLFLTMLKIGLFTFGGGYAMIAILENEIVTRREWLDREEFLDMVAIAESTPGPIAINSATYVGYRLSGFLGAILATLGMCIPSFVIIYLISLVFDAFLSLSLVAAAFRGIQVAVIYLILSAGVRMLRKMNRTPFNIIIVSAVTVTMVTLSVLAVSFSSIFYILISGTLGLVVYLVGLARKGRGTGQ